VRNSNCGKNQTRLLIFTHSAFGIPNFDEEVFMKRTLVILLLMLTAAATAFNPAEAGRKKDNRPDGGSLNYGEYGRPATLDPVTSNEMISLRLTELIFNGLVGINEKQEIVPELAERWDRSADNRTYTFFLRKDVVWHPKEGEEPKPFTADDVISPTRS
jgi:ABC-type transport system substrate-binding protein